jgi:hypothetical protein
MRDLCIRLLSHFVFSKLNILRKTMLGVLCAVMEYCIPSLVCTFIIGVDVWQ